jgi:F420-dependent oxidoreductase-like protein
MRLGLNFGFLTSRVFNHVALAREAERLGYYSVWTAEAWGSDCITPLTWIAAKTEKIHLGTAVMQMPARTPANTAMTAATLDLLSRERFLLGLGVSGPQVVEGWHGVHYGKPLARTREYVEIVRRALKREEPLEFHGEYYDIPVQGGTGLGKPLKMLLNPVRPAIPVYLAALGPKNVALAAEIADGWLPVLFSPEKKHVFQASLEEGFARAGTKDRARFDIAPTVNVEMGPDIKACRDSLKPTLALYIGGMGAKGKNFYYDLICRYGYEEAARDIQDLYLAGSTLVAIDAVPDALVDELALCGPPERIAERLQAWRGSGVTTLICSTTNPATIRTLPSLL